MHLLLSCIFARFFSKMYVKFTDPLNPFLFSLRICVIGSIENLYDSLFIIKMLLLYLGNFSLIDLV